MSDDNYYPDDEEQSPEQGEYISPDELRSQRIIEAVIHGNYTPQQLDAPEYEDFTLLELLTLYNSMLQWNQSDLARASGIEQADINRIFTGKSERPYYKTLQRIAKAYEYAGLDITIEKLIAARDRKTTKTASLFEIPRRWKALIRKVQTLPVDDQEAIFIIYSQILDKWTLAHVYRDRAKSPKNED